MKKLTLGPLPLFSDFFSAIFCSSLPDSVLSFPWSTKREISFWFSRSAWSLKVIIEAYMQANSNTRLIVWIPDYFCNSSLNIIRELNVKLVFYPITKELVPDINWCNSQSLIQKPDIFLLVHYFGQPTELAQVKEFCIKNNSWLIEDAAHVLKPVKGVGEAGDFVLYSPHKHFPIPDGALMILRSNGPGNFGKDKHIIDLVYNASKKLIKSSQSSNLNLAVWFIKRTLQLIGVRLKIQHIPFWPDLDYSTQYTKYSKMSSFAKRLLSKQYLNLDAIEYNRKLNCKNWETNLLNIDILYKKLRNSKISETPYFATFISQNFETTENIYKLFQSFKLPVTSWPDLPPEVLQNKELHKNAIKFRKTRIYIAVHQSIKSNNIYEICNTLNNKINIPN